MVTEEGIVERVAGKKAWVRITRSGSCSTCSSRGACNALSDRDMLLELPNELGARPGDRVELGVPSGSFLRLTALVYMFPIASLILGAAVAGAWAESSGMSATLAALMGGAGALGLSLLTLRRLDSAWRGKKKLGPRMQRIKLGAGAQLDAAK